MRVFAFCVTVTLCAACGEANSPPPAAPATSSAAPTSSVAPTISVADVARTRASLPPGYEVSGLPANATPIALWGLGLDAASDPPDCLGLADPLVGGVPGAGWSASGPGGIVYVVAARANDAAPAVDPERCAPWTMHSDRTDAIIAFADAPPIADAATLGLITELATQVEGGTQTHSRAQTFSARFAGYAAYVVAVTDPGATGPALPPSFASDLLIDAVAAMRAEMPGG